MARTKQTPGQRLWLSLCRVDEYDQRAVAITPPEAAGRADPQQAAQNWFRGISKQIKESFPESFARLEKTPGSLSSSSRKSRSCL